ncbi:hypothetical protein BP6252_09958 [Coleophoma cylindrospora]|uniref:Uncharacterized protein n=1 Tax=Coleophoma cylindrospora TaxID=1849047 RepID=A0A3D8QWW4_9HELO|nr:hypothetical protein BP6252_09958 [Coleophoma cylindrospora]
MSFSDSQPSNAVPFGNFGNSVVERVFPIRNLVVRQDYELAPTFDPPAPPCVTKAEPEPDEHPATPPAAESTNASSETIDLSSLDPGLKPSEFLPPPYPQVPAEETLRRLSIPATSPDVARELAEEPHLRRISERTQLVPAASGPPGVLPGSILASSAEGQRKFYRCEDEPIHIPGAIQQFGALIALRYDDAGDLKVRVASENTKKILQYGPERLLLLGSFLDLLEEEAREDFENRVAHQLAMDRTTLVETHLDVFIITITNTVGQNVPLWCAIHISASSPDLIVCEFENFVDVFQHDGLHAEKILPKTPAHTIDNEVSEEERIKSTTSMSEPLRALQLARRRRKKALGSMEIFNAMTQAQQQLSGAKSVQGILDIVVGLVAELTGFHRVMIYRFDNHKNGCVVSELVDPKASDDLFRGLNFPASDIPKQARDLYLINRIRILYDRDEETARFLGREIEDSEKPLDLTHAYLRAMSPIHIKYLQNMDVRSTMSISLVINNDLWGLVACHHYGEQGIRVTLPIRELCRNIGECASTNIDRLLMLQRLQARKPPSTVPPAQDPAGFIAASSADLLRVFNADFGLLNIQDEARSIGKLDPYREALALLAFLQSRRTIVILSSQNINVDFQELKYPPGIKSISGLLVIPLSVTGADFIVFFRKGQLKEVRWAGNPYEKALKPGSQYLEPRASFKRWTEFVVGMSKAWTEDQMDTAAVLSLLYGRFIEIWRQKESPGLNTRMTRLLLRNSSHEVRTPLNQILNYLEIALETSIEESTREILQKAHKASRSLVYVIDDLLNLTKAEDGKVSGPNEVFDLTSTVSEVIAAFRREAMRKGIDLVVSTHPGLPTMVKGDSARLRQIISNITSNAFQSSVAGSIKVDIRCLRAMAESSIISITIQDAGMGMSEDQLDTLFQEFEQVLDDEEDHSMGSSSSTPSIPGTKEPLGLGLAVVARYVRNMNGQIRVQSELGVGTLFGIELPFDHASAAPTTPGLAEASSYISTNLSTAELSIQVPDDNQNKTPSSPVSARKQSVDQSEDMPGQPSELEETTGNPVLTSHEEVLFNTMNFRVANDYINATHGDIFPAGIRDLPKFSLSVLVAEDNPINARLLSQRLLKAGHKVEVAYDGQACHDYFVAQPDAIDVILMDLQMPLVDGHQSTRMIRSLEKELEATQGTRARVPIIAVSASLVEDHRFEYMECGFDAWILKPIDVSRLDFLLRGIQSQDLRRTAQYVPGLWSKGGWFFA